MGAIVKIMAGVLRKKDLCSLLFPGDSNASVIKIVECVEKLDLVRKFTIDKP